MNTYTTIRSNRARFYSTTFLEISLVMASLAIWLDVFTSNQGALLQTSNVEPHATHNTFRHCRVRFCAVGQLIFSKQLYVNSQQVSLVPVGILTNIIFRYLDCSSCCYTNMVILLTSVKHCLLHLFMGHSDRKTSTKLNTSAAF